MLEYENDELLVIKVCPRCAKAGRGRGIISTENRFLIDGTYTECLLCGWFGDQDQCQEYCFPCEIRKTVVMDLEVVENLWRFALRKDERAIIKLRGFRGVDLTYRLRAEDCKDRLMKMDHCPLEIALEVLVARGCLLPGVYEIQC